MSRRAVVPVLLGLVLTTALATISFVATPPSSLAPAADGLASLPLAFEPTGDAGYVSRGPGYSLALTSPGLAVVGVRGGSFRLRPAGPTANPGAILHAGDPLSATVTRIEGDDPGRWTTNPRTYGRVEVRQVWPGVDMVWHGDQRRLQHDMVVAPGVDPAVVALDVEGAASLALAPGGDLVVDLGTTSARLARPVLYQGADGARRPVAGEFALLAPSRIGFRVGEYDRTLPLVIDPTLVTSTLLGGGGVDSGYAIAVDAQGSTYVAGSTESADFPLATPLQGTLANAGGGPTSDVFVSKLSPDGSRLLWSTYLGGGGRDTGYAIAVGSDGGVYVTGVTESADFPRARAAQESSGGGPSDAFVAKLAASGTALEWSTFVGGSETDRARGLAVDRAGNAFLAGSTNSVDFPSVNAYQPGPFRADDMDAFLVKVPASGGPLSYATRLGGSNDDRGLAVAVDGQGNAYVTGDTLSPGFPTVRPIQGTSGGSAGGVAGSFPDAFVAKFDPTGATLVYSTFLGGGDIDQGTAIAVDAQGAAYVAGNTNSADFPTASPLQPQKANDADAFVAKIDGPGAALVYSTYVGGAAADGANAVAVDRSGNAHVVGTTGSANWPTNRPVQASRSGGEDAFLLTLDAGGRSAFSTFVGGRDSDAGMGVAVDPQGAVRMLGLTGSPDFPSVRPLQGARPAAGGDAFVATVDLADAAPAPATGAPSPAVPATTSTASDVGHDRRVRFLGALTIVLLLAAVLQTLYLRRRPAPATAGQPSRPSPKPSAAPGVKVLGDAGTAGAAAGAVAGAGGRAANAPAKAAASSKSNRSPKARGGPKGGGQKTNTKAPAAAAGGGPPTKPKRQEPAIAQLLEEDLWAPPAPPAPAAPEAPEAPPVEAPAPAPDQPAAVEETTAEAPPPPPTPPPPPPPPPESAPPAPPPAPPPSPPPGPERAPAIPPVPAEELSFWDLFPEDLPPARTTDVPVEDVLVENLALPEGPDSNAGRLIAPLPDEVDGPEDRTRETHPPPPGAEVVIAELLDGPLPTDLSRGPQSPWPPKPEDELVISDLLDEPGDGRDAGDGGDDEDDTRPPSPAGPGDDQARIAADRARRRRNRRSGRRRSPGSG